MHAAPLRARAPGGSARGAESCALPLEVRAHAHETRAAREALARRVFRCAAKRDARANSLVFGETTLLIARARRRAHEAALGDAPADGNPLGHIAERVHRGRVHARCSRRAPR